MSDEVSRREWVGAIAIGFAGAGTRALPGLPAAQDPKPTDTKQPPADEPSPPSDADARLDLVLARFGKHLDEAARQAVTREIQVVVNRGKQLREYALENDDAPMPLFLPYRGPIQGP
jgi:hypothetical protein